MIGWLFAVAGGTAGSLQARMLVRAGPLHAVARISLVGVVLLAAAMAGHIASAAAGWFAGFGAASVIAYRRLR